MRTNCANKLHLDSRVLQALAIFGSDSHGTLHGLAVHVQGNPLSAALVELDIDRLASVQIIKDNVDIDGGGEEEGSHDVQCGDALCSARGDGRGLVRLRKTPQAATMRDRD